jgi:hypothetical protein
MNLQIELSKLGYVARAEGMGVSIRKGTYEGTEAARLSAEELHLHNTPESTLALIKQKLDI